MVSRTSNRSIGTPPSEGGTEAYIPRTMSSFSFSMLWAYLASRSKPSDRQRPLIECATFHGGQLDHASLSLHFMRLRSSTWFSNSPEAMSIISSYMPSSRSSLIVSDDQSTMARSSLGSGRVVGMVVSANQGANDAAATRRRTRSLSARRRWQRRPGRFTETRSTRRGAWSRGCSPRGRSSRESRASPTADARGAERFLCG
mmetsp:Transcript_15922/g.64182  ORF Transcript_15922/g.64182 Transcript_15922/m.64182 type:complete len:201 (-) Transcript_15922:39-641(-)